MPPQVNATLTAVHGQQANAETFEGPPAKGAQKWAGTAPAYYRQARDRERGATGEDRTIRRELLIDTGTVALASGDFVTWTDADGEHQGTVKLVEPRRLAGIPGELQTTRITLERA